MSNLSKKKKLVLAAMAGILVASSVPAMLHAAEAADVKCAGVNACKGTGACKGDSNACKGQNACKGHGVVATATADECTSQGGTVVTE